MAAAVEYSNIYISETTTATDISLTFTGRTPSDGNTIILIVGGGDGGDVFSATGFTKIVSNLGTSGQYDSIAVFAKQASSEGSAPTYTVTTDSAGDTFWIVGYEISGLVTSSWLDVVTSDANYESSPSSPKDCGTTGTTTQADEIAIAVVGLWAGATPDVTAWSNSFTQDEELFETGGWDIEVAAASKILTATGTVNTGATFTGTASEGHGTIFTLKASATATSGTLNGGGSIFATVVNNTTTATVNGGGSISATASKFEDQIARPDSTITPGSWDTGPTTGQNLHTYTSDQSDATWIEDTAG